MLINALVLWDIDRTLLYAGNVDQMIYREVFRELIGRPATVLPERGTGITTPIVLYRPIADNGVPDKIIPSVTRDAMLLLPALAAVHTRTGLIQTVVTGNLKPNAVIKLTVWS